MITDAEVARDDPELAVLSEMAPVPSAEGSIAARVATAALAGATRLVDDRAALCCNLVLRSLSPAAQEVLRKMEPANYEYQSDFATHYFAPGVAQGEAQGQAEMLLKLLTLRFGALTPETEARVRAASLDDLNRFAERILTAATVEEALA